MTVVEAVWRTRRLAVGAIMVLLAAAVVSSLASAQSARKLKKGDVIQVHFLNKWWEGKVVATNARGEALAEYEFAGRQNQKAFKRNEVRLAYEADAIAPSRMWSDPSGDFKIRAALLAINVKTVKLRKEDMTEIDVPRDRLSTGDQAFIKRKEKELGPVAASAPDSPPTEQCQLSGESSANGSARSVARVALDPDPLPDFVKLKEGGAAFGMRDFHYRLRAVLPLGGADSWLIAAVENGNPSKPLATRLLWVSLAKKKVAGQQLLPAGEIVLDYHARSHRLLTYAKIKKADDPWGKPVLTLWEALPTDKEVKPIVRWAASSDERAPNEPWARLVDGNIVLQRWTKNEFVAWDVQAKATRYRTKQEAFFAPPPTLSGGRRYLFIHEDKNVRILEAATGRLVCMLPAEDGAAAVAATEDGRRLAVLSRSSLTVWDLTDAQAQPQRYQAEAIGAPFGTTLSWVGDQRLMADTGPRGQVLFSLKHRLALWNYQFDASAVRDYRGGQRLREIVNNHLVYAASVGLGAQRGLAVGAVKLPGPKVDETALSLNRDSLMILKPGSAVRLDIRTGEYSPQVKNTLLKELQANGWTDSPTSTATLFAEMKRGEQQTVTYRMSDGSEQSATFAPHISSLRLQVGDQLAWQSATSSSSSSFITLREGETVQSEIDKWQRPNPGFFEQVDIPEQILDPAKRNGLGSTKVTNRGLVAEWNSAGDIPGT